jgi:hypothetical protein
VGWTLTDNDPIKHPSHYTNHPSGVECIQIAQHHNFNIGNVIKYVWRAGLKEGSSEVKDLRKAIQYLEFEIARIEGERARTWREVVETPTLHPAPLAFAHDWGTVK